MVFKEIAKSKLKTKDFLWRYIDLHKLLDLASNKYLYFNRLDQYNDPFEGITRNLIAQRHIAKKPPPTNPAIPLEVVEANRKQSEATLENYEVQSQIKRKTQFANCWIKSTRESNAMWNLYSNKDSIALKTNAHDLVKYFETNIKLQPLLHPKFEFICGSVTYCMLNPIDLFEKVTLPRYSAFKKDVSYDYEKEFRFLIATPKDVADDNPKFIRLDITPSFFELMDIVCHPEMPTWKFKNVESICSKYKLPKPIKSEVEIIT